MALTRAIRERVTELKFHKLVMAARQLGKFLVDAYPSMRLRLSKAKRDLIVAEFNQCSTVGECMEFTRRHMKSGSCQNSI